MQSRGRSILIALLIALPIVGLAGVDTVEASHDATAQDSARLQLGRNQGLLTIVSPPDPSLRQDPLDNIAVDQKVDREGQPVVAKHPAPTANPRALLPAGTRIIGVTNTVVVAKTRTGSASFPADEGAVWDPAFTGKYTLVAGKRPIASDQIMVTPGALARFGIQLGDEVTITQPRSGTFTVVGTLRNSSLADSDVELFGRSGAFDGVAASHDVMTTFYYLPDLALTWSQIRSLNGQGATVLSRRVMLDPPPTSVAPRLRGTNPGNPIGILIVSLLGAFALFEVCLLAGAAFAVGARHQQRMLAILSSVGGERRTLFRVISYGGILLGLVGGIIGTALGVLAAWVAIPILSNGNQSIYPNFHLDIPVLLLVIVASTVSGWIAAAIPARTAARTDVVGALRGSQRPPRTSTRRPLAGLVIAAIGVALSLVGGILVITSHQGSTLNQNLSTIGIVLLVAGPITMQIGVILIVPLLLRWVMALLAGLGAGTRLGARDASRNPSRTVPAVAAIMSTVFVSSLVMCLLAGAQVLTIRDYQWTAPLNFARVSMYKYNANGTESRMAGSAAVQAVINRDYGVVAARVISSTPDVNLLGKTVPEYVVPRLDRGKDQGSYLSSWGDTDHITIGTPADLAAIIGQPLTAGSRSTLEAGGVISLWPQYVNNGNVTLDWFTAGTELGQPKGKPLRTVMLPAVVQQPQHTVDYGMFMLASTASKLKIPYAPTTVIAALPAAPTSAEQDATYSDLQVLNPELQPPQVETGPAHFGAGWYWALLGLATLIALGTSVVALSLARADGRRDDGVLDSIGAPPRVRRSFGFVQGAIIAGLGSIIGVALGLVPAFALGLPVAKLAHGFVPFAPPWVQLALTAFAIPLIIAIGGWLLAGRVRVQFNTRAPIG